MTTAKANLSNTDLGIKERGKSKYPNDYAIGDYYKYYKANISTKELPLGTPVNNLSYNIPAKKYRAVLVSIFRKAREKMILNNLEYTLPCKMGKITICKFKKKIKLDEEGNLVARLAVDYRATRELWATDEQSKLAKRVVFHLNDHTEGYTFKIVWVKNNCTMYKKKFYKLIPIREFKRELPKLMSQNPNLDFYTFKNSD